jgi:hypothetical protein
MRVVASADVAGVVSEHGGKLYVWPRKGLCCGRGVTTLKTGTEPKDGVSFEHVAADGFELYLASMAHQPEELHLDVHGGWRRRVAAYWDNCAYVVLRAPRKRESAAVRSSRSKCCSA